MTKPKDKEKWEETIEDLLSGYFDAPDQGGWTIGDCEYAYLRERMGEEITGLLKEERAKTIREMDEKHNAYCEKKVREAGRETISRFARQLIQDGARDWEDAFVDMLKELGLERLPHKSWWETARRLIWDEK